MGAVVATPTQGSSGPSMTVRDILTGGGTVGMLGIPGTLLNTLEIRGIHSRFRLVFEVVAVEQLLPQITRRCLSPASVQTLTASRIAVG